MHDLSTASTRPHAICGILCSFTGHDPLGAVHRASARLRGRRATVVAVHLPFGALLAAPSRLGLGAHHGADGGGPPTRHRPVGGWRLLPRLSRCVGAFAERTHQVRPRLSHCAPCIPVAD